ncbi:3-isopropylmalate dehydrogenase [Colletotrichum incanum]|nr:3-isopropylmalate dehydrogenase [Colletotrichum incanum]
MVTELSVRFGNLRPINFSLPPLVDTSPMKANVRRCTDFFIARELTSGIYLLSPRAWGPHRHSYGPIHVPSGREGGPPGWHPMKIADPAKASACGFFWRRIAMLHHTRLQPDKAQRHRVDEQFYGDITSGQGTVVADSIGLFPCASLRGLSSQTGSSRIKGLYKLIHEPFESRR